MSDYKLKFRGKLDLINILEKHLEPCNGCNGTKVREYEYWTGLYKTEKCNICNGEGKRLNKELSDFFKKYL